jgi:hypothetical protein
MPPNGARAEPADRNKHDGHQGKEECRLDQKASPLNLSMRKLKSYGMKAI